MVSIIGQGTQYKGFGVSRVLTLLHIRIEIGYSAGYGNFSDVSVLKRVIDEITETELHPEKLADLRQRYMEEVNILREIRDANEDAHDRVWLLCPADHTPPRGTHQDKALCVLEAEKERIAHDLREMKRAALCVASVERAVSEKDIPF